MNVIQTIAKRMIQRNKFILIGLSDPYPVLLEPQGLEPEDYARAIYRLCEQLGVELTVRQKESIDRKVTEKRALREDARQPISEELLR